MDKQQKNILLVLCAVLVVVLVAVVVVALRVKQPVVGEFVAPSFEQNAQKGTPQTLPASFGTVTVRDGFKIGMCAAPTIDGLSLGLCFTSPETNDVWMRVRICDKAGNVLGESGLLKPGEYLESLTLTSAPQATDKLYATILSYQPDTYYSQGSVDLELMPYVTK